MGGEDNLTGIKVFSAKGKGQITLEGRDYDFTFEMTAKGIDKYRSSPTKSKIDGTKYEGVTVLERASRAGKEGARRRSRSWMATRLPMRSVAPTSTSFRS